MSGLPQRPAGAPDPADPFAGPLCDAQGRVITYLRLSLTERCNFKCGYCTPQQGGPGGEPLGADALVALVSVFARLGVRRVRLTGGEPLLRPDVLEIARRLRSLPGIAGLAMTTNGHLLDELGPALLEAGVTRLNVSLDSLQPERFRALTGGAGRLDKLLAGLEACTRAGFRDLKVNTVVMGGVNDDEVAGIIRFAWARGIVPRFIECMPFAQGKPVPTLELIERLGREGIGLRPASPALAGAPAGPSEYWLGEGGRVGFIGPLTRNFCSGCNRVRLASNGDLRACLGGTQAVALAPLLSGPDPEAHIARTVRGALLRKPDGHQMTAPGARLELLSIRGIGG